MARKGNYISKTGYKKDSPDRNRPYNVIPSGQITMKNVPHPVLGIDNFGNQQMMMPGAEYNFPGNFVTEYPIRQLGGQNYKNMAYMNLNRFMQQGGIPDPNPENPYVITNPEMLDNQFTGPFYSTDKDYDAMLRQQRRDWNTWGNPATDTELAYMQSHMYPTHAVPGGKGMVSVFPMANPSNEVLAPTMNMAQEQYDKNVQILQEQMAQEKRMGGKPCYACGGKHQFGGDAPAGYHYMPDGTLMANSAHMAGGGKWIQGVTEGIKARGTEGRCSGKNFGGPGCPKGSPQYNLAVTFRKMAKNREKQMGGTADMNVDVDNILEQRKNNMTTYIQNQVGMNIANEVDQQAQDAILAGYEAMMQMGGMTSGSNVGAFIQAQQNLQNQRSADMYGLKSNLLNLGLNANPFIRTKIKNQDMDYKFKYDRPWDPSFNFGYGGMRKAQTGVITGRSGDDIFSPEEWEKINAIDDGSSSTYTGQGNFTHKGEAGYIYDDGSGRVSMGKGITYHPDGTYTDASGATVNYDPEQGVVLDEDGLPIFTREDFTDEEYANFQNMMNNQNNSGGKGNREHEGSSFNTGSYDPAKTDPNQATGTGTGTTEPASGSEGSGSRGNYQGSSTGQPNYGAQPNYGMMAMYPGVQGFGNILYNPYNTFLESMDERARLFGPGLRRRKTTFTHGPFSGGFTIDPQTGQPVVDISGMQGEGVQYDTLGNPYATPDYKKEDYIERHIDPTLQSKKMHGDISDEEQQEWQRQYEQYSSEYDNSRLPQLQNTPDNTPVQTDFRTKFQNWRQEREAEKERKKGIRTDRRNERKGVTPFKSAVHPDYDPNKGNMGQQQQGGQTFGDGFVNTFINPMYPLDVSHRVRKPQYQPTQEEKDAYLKARQEQYGSDQYDLETVAWNDWIAKNPPGSPLNPTGNITPEIFAKKAGFMRQGGVYNLDITTLMKYGGLPMHQVNGVVNPMNPTAIQKINNNPGMPEINAYDAPYGNAYGTTTVDERLKFQYNPEELVGATIAGMDVVSSMFDQRENRKLQKQIEEQLTADAINPVISMEASPYGSYDPNTGDFRYREKTPVFNAGYNMMGSIGSGEYQAKYGGKMEMKQGGEYELSQAEIDAILAAGGEVEYL